MENFGKLIEHLNRLTWPGVFGLLLLCLLAAWIALLVYRFAKF